MQDSLLPRIASGDQSAVPECISRYGGLIWTLARRRLASREDAEDVVQEVFVDLWRSADRFAPQVAEVSEKLPHVFMTKKEGKVLHLDSSCRHLVARETQAMNWCSTCGSAKTSKVA